MRTLLLPLVLALGCPSSHEVDLESIPTPVAPADPLDVGDSTSVSLGVDGGLVQIGELALRVPAGALDAPTTIRITATSTRTPTGFTSYTPVLRFEPAGLRFRTPATIEIPFAGDSRLATVFWTDEAGAFTALPTEVEGAVARASVEHFSQAFVGTACQGAECCRRAVGAVDVLFVVDNSNSMADEHAALAREIPRVVQALATGDADGDGTQDFPAIASLRTGVITTDMGTGGFAVPTCSNARVGDDGILRTRGNTALSGCDAVYPSFLDFESRDDLASFASEVSCVSTIGTNGCGFEQQLEATLKALTPSSSTTEFHGGTRGHADGHNMGFLRDEALLLIVMLTDEDDCSAIDPEIFDPASSRYAGDLNLRCSTYTEAVQPVSRFVQGLIEAKGDAVRLVFAPIVGFPVDLEGAAIDTILADSRMEERVDPSMPSRLRPACEGRSQAAFPAHRILQVAEGLEEDGAAAVPSSICQGDFGGPIARILDRVSARVGGSCE